MSKPQIPFEPGYLYHLFNHASSDESLFMEHKNFHRFLMNYRKYIVPVADTFAYCLMPNHFHLLVRIKNHKTIRKLISKEHEEKDYLAHQFGNLQNAYARYFNIKYQRKGPLFQTRIKRKKINSGNYFKQAVQYIHMNPVYHEFVDNPGDWKYSSYSSYNSKRKTLVNRDDFISFIGGREAFNNIHNLKGIEKYSIDMDILY
jgi:REP element-mobilizing transposase RayT